MARTNREARALDGAAEREFICLDSIPPPFSLSLPLLRFASFICLFYVGAIFMDAGTRVHPNLNAGAFARESRSRTSCRIAPLLRAVSLSG